ncbi:MAG: asparagine synthase-related protein [Candidatus Peribacteraceae bacterium]|nr:asparagine synthase-related protein [Candidatus Peribacteraceae bacterium]
MKKHLSGKGVLQEVKGDWFAAAQHGFNSSAREGNCIARGNAVTQVFEGRIDNRSDILRDLNLRDDADYSSILHEGYLRWGADLYRRLSGAFASAIINTRSKVLQLFRDPLALRPLYYSQNAGDVRFGSNVRQLLAADGAKRSISERKLLELFSPIYLIDEGWSDADATMFEGIHSVPFGSFIEFQKGTFPRTERYWTPPKRLRRDWVSPEECAKEFRALYLKIIAEHIDTPFGIAAELSGGIDSGCNVSIAAHLLSDSGRGIDAYTAVFGSQSKSERRRVRSICERYPNVRGHMVDCDEQIGFLEGSSLQAYRTTSNPSRQNLPATFVALANQAKEDNAQTLLSGEGADWYLEGTDMIWDALVKTGNFTEIRRVFNVLRQRSSCRRALQYVLKNAFPSLLPGSLGRCAFLRAQYESTVVGTNIPDIFTTAFRSKLEDMLKEQRDQLYRKRNLSCWSQTLEHELMFPPNHVWQDVPVDVEMRMPYLDRRIVEFGLSVPPEYKFRIDAQNISHYGCRKFLQRAAFRDIVPDIVISSQKKETYGSPVNRRLTQEFPRLLEDPMVLCEMGVIERKKLVDAAQAFLSDGANELNQLIPWLDNVLATEKWLRATREEFSGCRLPTFVSHVSDRNENNRPDQ